MARKVIESEYQFNPPFSMSKRVISYLFDCVLIIILTILIFKAVDAIFVSGNRKLKEWAALMSESEVKVTECLSDAGLMNYDKEKEQSIEDAVQGKNFIYSLVLSTLKEDVTDTEAYKGEFIYSDFGSKNYSVVFYYADFKPNNSDKFNNYNAESVGIEYVRNKIFSESKNTENAYFDEAQFPLLNRNVALALDKLISDNEKSCEIEGVKYYASDIYKELYGAFNTVLQEARKDVSEHYLPYIEIEKDFIDARNKTVRMKIGELIISYAVCTLIYFVLIPLIAKGQTASYLLLGGRSINRSGTKLLWYNYILRYFASFLVYLSNVMFVVLFSYGRYSSFFLMSNLFGGFKFYMLYLIAIVAVIVSAVCMLFDKENKRSLADRLAGITVKEK